MGEINMRAEGNEGAVKRCKKEREEAAAVTRVEPYSTTKR